ncbi:hypothetical protein GGR54DRAFT_523864 [Hypoxylon sp. NC1633]|nr:hypothetical protein GGR54DRAFT_523864 [Hypoxylon sp. NC1633]
MTRSILDPASRERIFTNSSAHQINFSRSQQPTVAFGISRTAQRSTAQHKSGEAWISTISNNSPALYLFRTGNLDVSLAAVYQYKESYTTHITSTSAATESSHNPWTHWQGSPRRHTPVEYTETIRTFKLTQESLCGCNAPGPSHGTKPDLSTPLSCFEHHDTLETYSHTTPFPRRPRTKRHHNKTGQSVSQPRDPSGAFTPWRNRRQASLLHLYTLTPSCHPPPPFSPSQPTLCPAAQPVEEMYVPAVPRTAVPRLVAPYSLTTKPGGGYTSRTPPPTSSSYVTLLFATLLRVILIVSPAVQAA